MSGEPVVARKPGIRDLHGVDCLPFGVRDGRGVAVLRQAPHQVHEERADMRREVHLRPFHPLLGHRKALVIGRPEHPCPEACREIAHDGVGLEHGDIAVTHHRHEAHRVHGEEVGILVAAEAAADVLAAVGHLEFLERPQHLLHVDRIPAAPQRDHDPAPAKCGASMRHARAKTRGPGFDARAFSSTWVRLGFFDQFADAVFCDRNFMGSSATAPLRTSKCSCGLETEPV